MNSVAAGGASRYKRFSPDEQAVAVWLSHTVILIVVGIIMWRAFDKAPALGFLIGEGIIWVTFALLVPKYDRPATLVRRYLPAGASTRKLEDWQETAFPIAFAIAFVLQFVALKFLLVQTGGPIGSPFAQLAIAFAVFTPILANETSTILIALCATIAYYWYMLEKYGYGHVTVRPSTAVFGAVTTLIVALTVGLALLDRLDADRQSRSAT